MARPYGHLSDPEIAELRAVRRKEIEENKTAEKLIRSEPHGDADLAYSHRCLVLAREGAALSKDDLELYMEQHMRSEGLVQRIERAP